MNILGGITFENFKGLTGMPQKAASAWVAADGGLTGAGYKPLLFVGTQVAKGTNYHFIAEQTVIYSEPEKHVVKLAVNEFEGKYQLVPDSIKVIY